MWLATVGFALSGYQLATASLLAFDTAEGTMPSKPQGYFLAGMAAISGVVLFAISRGLETKEYSAEEANTESWEEDGIITKDYPPLYKIKFGSDKIQEWAIWTEYDEATDISTVFTEHGVTGGTITPSEGEIIEEGKGKKTVREQADGVALSKWRVKRRKGYVEDLDITPDTVFIAPMTALNFHNHGHKIDFPAIAQRKYDGVRCVADTQLDGTVNLITRRGKQFYDLDHIRDEIGAMGLPPTIRLDGEMYADPSIMSFEESCGLVKKKYYDDADLERAKNIGYHLYDMIDLENLDMPYMERYAFLKALVEKYKPANIDVVENYEVNSEEEARILHDQFVEEGYEGLMFRNKDSPYAIDRQSKDLQKYKDFQDAEFEVVGFTEGKGRNKGTVIWKCQMPDNGRTFNVQPKGTAAQRREWFEHGDEYIGKMLTVKFFRLTEKGVPFHGSGIVFRDYEAETDYDIISDPNYYSLYTEAGKRQSFSASTRIGERKLFINPAEDSGIICIEFREEYIGQIVVDAKDGEVHIALLDADESVLGEESIELVKEAEYRGKRSYKQVGALAECDITIALEGRTKELVLEDWEQASSYESHRMRPPDFYSSNPKGVEMWIDTPESGRIHVVAKGTDYDYADYALFEITVNYEPEDGRLYVLVENESLGKLFHEPIGELVFNAE